MFDKMIKNALNTVQKCVTLLLLFILFDITISIINSLPLLLPGSKEPPLISVPLTIVLTLVMIPVVTFFHAGLYGITFLKINSQKVDIYKFINLALKNFIEFLRIDLTMIAISVAMSGLFWVVIPPLLKNIPVLAFGPIQYATLFNYLSIFLFFLTELFFFFSYPLVMVGYFSDRNLKPLRTSFSYVIRHARKIRMVIIILVIKFILGRIFNGVIPNEYLIPSKTIMPFILTPLSFLALVYSFLLLKECFYKDLEYNYEKTA